jgi:hypothetical protein
MIANPTSRRPLSFFTYIYVKEMTLTYLITKDFDNLLFLDVLNVDFREHSKLISILISSLIQQSPLLNIYEEKKKLLLDTLNSQRLNEKNLFREKMVRVIFLFGTLKYLNNFYKNDKKLNESGKNGIDFLSNIGYARNHLQKYFIIVLKSFHRCSMPTKLN